MDAEGTGGYYSRAAVIIAKCTSKKNGKRGKETDQQDWLMLQSSWLVAARCRLLMLFFSAGGESQTEGGNTSALLHVLAYMATRTPDFRLSTPSYGYYRRVQ